MGEALRVLVVGLGRMGLSHARTYDDLDRFTLAGLCARTIGKRTDLPEAWSSVPRFSGFDEALASVRPEVVSINTYPDTHAQHAIRAIEARARLLSKSPSPRRWRTPSASSTGRRRTAAS
jgi:predicted dehydrogenase